MTTQEPSQEPKDSGTSDSQPETITLTKKEYSDQLSRAGFQKISEKDTEIARLNAIIQERNLADEFAKVDQTDPKQMSAWNLKLENQQKDAEIRRLNQLIQDSEPYVTKGKEVERLETVRSVALDVMKGYEGVSIEDVIRRTDGTREDIIAFCNQFGTKLPEPPAGSPDSGVTGGVQGKMTVQEADDADMETFRARRMKEGAPYREL